MWRPQITFKPVRNDDELRAAFRYLEGIFQVG